LALDPLSAGYDSIIERELGRNPRKCLPVKLSDGEPMTYNFGFAKRDDHPENSVFEFRVSSFKPEQEA
jgi:hypothetical protein